MVSVAVPNILKVSPAKPSQRPKITASIEVLHLLRHLLRASSYLPDSVARSYTHKHIISRFRKQKSTPARLKDGRQALSAMQRAAEGESKALYRILYDSYGRSGPRRRELIAIIYRTSSLSQRQAFQFDEDIQQHIDAGGGSDKAMKEETTRTRKAVMALIESQHRNPPALSERLRIKLPLSEEEVVSTPNVFGRPMALKLRKGKLRRWWAGKMDSIYPPLPESEWNRLRDLATGVIRPEIPPARRRLGIETTKQMLGQSPAISNGPALRVSTLNLGTASPSPDTADSSNTRRLHVHNLTSSFLRRAYAAIWSLTPMMTYDGTKDTWSVIWGGSRSSYSTSKISDSNGMDAEFFENDPPLTLNERNKKRITSKQSHDPSIDVL